MKQLKASSGLGLLLLGFAAPSQTAFAAMEDIEADPVSEQSGDADSKPDVSGGTEAPALTSGQPSEPESAQGLDTIPVNPQRDADAVPERSTVKNRIVEEIIVTAQKREENLQDVPISVQAFSGDAIAARGIDTTQELGQIVPGLQFTEAAGFTLIYIRGIGTDNHSPSSDPIIATYVDGIYIAGGQSTTQSLGNIQRVEVLKGPQGTLFGRNATGGAISVVTQEPGNTFEANAEGEVGNFNRRSGKVSVTTPITDWLSANVSGLASGQDNYYSNVNYDLQSDSTRAGRLKVNIHPTDDLSLSLTGFYTTQKGPGTLIGKNTDPTAIGRALLIQPQDDNYEAETDLFAKAKSHQEVYYGNLSWSLPLLDIRFLASHQEVVTDYVNLDFDGSPLPIAAFSISNGAEYSHLQSGELQFVSNEGTPFSDVFKWTAGLYYFHSNAGVDPANLRVAPQAFSTASSVFDVEIPEPIQNLFGRLPNTPLADGGINLDFRGLLETKSYSAYVQGTYYFTDWFDLTLGGRIQREERALTKASNNLAPPNGMGGGVDLFSFPLQSRTGNNFSPKAVLSFHPRDNALLYASYSVGFKSGTYNIVNIYVPPNYIQPEKVSSVELGAKVDFFSGLLRVNGAVFNNEISNLQSGFVSLLSGGAVRFLTAGSARTRGAEIDATWIPMPDLNPGLAVVGNVAYVDATYTDFPGGSGFVPPTGIYSANQDFSGNEIARAPKTSAGLAAVQTIDTNDGSIEIAIDEFYNSGFFYDAANTAEEKHYEILNARVGYRFNPWKLRVTAFGKNVLDRRYHIQQFQTDFGVIKTLAAPREYGVRLNWEF